MARRRDGISTPKLLLFDIRVAVVLSLGRCCYELNKEKDERQKDSLCCSHYVTNEDRGEEHNAEDTFRGCTWSTARGPKE